jgi:hypothetical protein
MSILYCLFVILNIALVCKYFKLDGSLDSGIVMLVTLLGQVGTVFILLGLFINKFGLSKYFNYSNNRNKD